MTIELVVFRVGDKTFTPESVPGIVCIDYVVLIESLLVLCGEFHV